MTMQWRVRFLGLTLSSLIINALIFNVQPASAASTNPTPVCNAGTCTVDFAYTGDYYAWTAPSSTTYTFELWGAQGGNAGYNGTSLGTGAKGGYAKGSTSLTSNQTIYVYVGGKGQGVNSTSTMDTSAGGFNGGGNGYNGDSTTDKRGAGGGGGTDIRINGNSLSNRVIVAGGGGGGGYCNCYGLVTPGVGGGTTGADGTTAGYSFTTHSGKGGTSTAGGVGGINGGTAQSGSSGQGGNGVSGHTYGAGGGGGGYFGGGGAGAGMGAGGGSGYVGGVSTTSLIAGNLSMPDPAGGTTTGRTGDGFVRITYTFVVGSVTLSIFGNPTFAVKGATQALVANINALGKVTFYADGKKIASCISIQGGPGNVSCNWKPTTQKAVRLTAVFLPSGGQSVTSTGLMVGVSKRSNTR